MRWISRFLDRLCTVLGAFLCAQLPQYFQQYTQRLAGHLAELQLQLEQVRKVAALSGKTLDAYIRKFTTHSDADFSRQGELMRAMNERVQGLTEALQAMQTATPWERPWAFLSHFQSDIARGTLDGFQPGLSLSLEGTAYAIIGLLLGYFVYFIISRSLRGLASLIMPGRKASSAVHS